MIFSPFCELFLKLDTHSLCVACYIWDYIPKYSECQAGQKKINVFLGKKVVLRLSRFAGGLRAGFLKYDLKRFFKRYIRAA